MNKEKEGRVKFNPGLSANRRSNNWAQGYFNLKPSRTGYKKLAHFENGVSILGEFFLEQGANLEFRATHTHLKNTQVPPGLIPCSQMPPGDAFRYKTKTRMRECQLIKRPFNF